MFVKIATLPTPRGRPCIEGYMQLHNNKYASALIVGLNLYTYSSAHVLSIQTSKIP